MPQKVFSAIKKICFIFIPMIIPLRFLMTINRKSLFTRIVSSLKTLGMSSIKKFDKMVPLPNVYMLRDFLYKEGFSSMNIYLYDDMSILFQVYVGNETHDIWMTFDELGAFFNNTRGHFEIISN